MACWARRGPDRSRCRRPGSHSRRRWGSGAVEGAWDSRSPWPWPCRPRWSASSWHLNHGPQSGGTEARVLPGPPPGLPSALLRRLLDGRWPPHDPPAVLLSPQGLSGSLPTYNQQEPCKPQEEWQHLSSETCQVGVQTTQGFLGHNGTPNFRVKVMQPHLHALPTGPLNP